MLGITTQKTYIEFISLLFRIAESEVKQTNKDIIQAKRTVQNNKVTIFFAIIIYPFTIFYQVRNGTRSICWLYIYVVILELLFV
jgi:hypothetical protein